MELAREHELRVLEPFGLQRAEELKATLRRWSSCTAQRRWTTRTMIERRQGSASRNSSSACAKASGNWSGSGTMPPAMSTMRACGSRCSQLGRVRRRERIVGGADDQRRLRGSRRCGLPCGRPPRRGGPFDIASHLQRIGTKASSSSGRPADRTPAASATARRGGCRRRSAPPRRSAAARRARGGRPRRCTASTTAPAPRTRLRE